MKKYKLKNVKVNSYFIIDEHSLSYYSVTEEKILIASGTYIVYIGIDSKDNNKISQNLFIS